MSQEMYVALITAQCNYQIVRVLLEPKFDYHGVLNGWKVDEIALPGRRGRRLGYRIRVSNTFNTRAEAEDYGESQSKHYSEEKIKDLENKIKRYDLKVKHFLSFKPKARFLNHIK